MHRRSECTPTLHVLEARNSLRRLLAILRSALALDRAGPFARGAAPGRVCRGGASVSARGLTIHTGAVGAAAASLVAGAGFDCPGGATGASLAGGALWGRSGCCCSGCCCDC